MKFVPNTMEAATAMGGIFSHTIDADGSIGHDNNDSEFVPIKAEAKSSSNVEDNGAVTVFSSRPILQLRKLRFASSGGKAAQAAQPPRRFREPMNAAI